MQGSVVEHQAFAKLKKRPNEMLNDLSIDDECFTVFQEE